MSLSKKRGARSRLRHKISIQERQIAELKLYIEAMKRLLFEKRALSADSLKN